MIVETVVFCTSYWSAIMAGRWRKGSFIAWLLYFVLLINVGSIIYIYFAMDSIWIGIDVDGSEQLTVDCRTYGTVESSGFCQNFGLMREFSLFLNENNVIQISFRFQKLRISGCWLLSWTGLQSMWRSEFYPNLRLILLILFRLHKIMLNICNMWFP